MKGLLIAVLSASTAGTPLEPALTALENGDLPGAADAADAARGDAKLTLMAAAIRGEALPPQEPLPTVAPDQPPVAGKDAWVNVASAAVRKTASEKGALVRRLP